MDEKERMWQRGVCILFERVRKNQLDSYMGECVYERVRGREGGKEKEKERERENLLQVRKRKS